jgi:hypothetical protein
MAQSMTTKTETEHGTEAINLFPGVALYLKRRVCGHKNCSVSHPPVWDLHVGKQRRYVGKELSSRRSQLNLTVEHELSERGYLKHDEKVRSLIGVLMRAASVIAASRNYLSQSQGLRLGEVLALPPQITKTIATQEKTLLIVLPTYGASQQLLIQEVRRALSGAAFDEQLCGIVTTRRAIALSPYVDVELGKQFLDERAVAFIGSPSASVLRKLRAVDCATLAAKINEARQNRRIVRGLPVTVHRRIRLVSPLVVELGTGSEMLSLDRSHEGALAVLNPHLSMPEFGLAKSARVLREMKEHLF